MATTRDYCVTFEASVCIAVRATSAEQAWDKIRYECGEKLLEIDSEPSICVLSKGDPIEVYEVEGSEDEDYDDYCEDCGRNMTEGAPHTADCEIALEQDREDGSL